MWQGAKHGSYFDPPINQWLPCGCSYYSFRLKQNTSYFMCLHSLFVLIMLMIAERKKGMDSFDLMWLISLYPFSGSLFKQVFSHEIYLYCEKSKVCWLYIWPAVSLNCIYDQWQDRGNPSNRVNKHCVLQARGIKRQNTWHAIIHHINYI